MAQARQALPAARWTAAHGKSRRDRRDAAKEVTALQAADADTTRRWVTHVDPEAARLDGQIARLEATVEQLSARDQHRTQTVRAVIEAGLEHQRSAKQLGCHLDAHRDHLDGADRSRRQTRAASRTSQDPTPAAAPSPEPPELGAGPDL